VAALTPSTLVALRVFTGRRPPGDHTYRLWVDGVGWLAAGTPTPHDDTDDRRSSRATQHATEGRFFSEFHHATTLAAHLSPLCERWRHIGPGGAR
jgi:hypothetical protein